MNWRKDISSYYPLPNGSSRALISNECSACIKSSLSIGATPEKKIKRESGILQMRAIKQIVHYFSLTYIIQKCAVSSNPSQKKYIRFTY